MVTNAGLYCSDCSLLIEDMTFVDVEFWTILDGFDDVDDIFKLLATDVKGNPWPTFQFN